MLGNREKIAVTLLAGIIVLLLAYTFIAGSAKADINNIDRKIRVKGKNLDELIKLKGEYNEIQASKKRMERQIRKTAKNITLPSLLETLANATKLKEHMTGLKTNETIKSKTYIENSVEISLKGIALDELISFIYHLESQPYMIKVKGFKIKTTYGKQPKLINLTLLVSLFTPN